MPPPEALAQLPDRVRAACAGVAARARHVAVDLEAVESYAAGLPTTTKSLDAEIEALTGRREQRAAFVLCLDAVNFGSGWWPTIRKRPGLSGYRTMAAGLGDRFRARGPWSAAQLAEMTPAEIATTLGQSLDHPLMAQYAATLRDVGGHVAGEHGGSFAAVVDSASGSAPALAGILATWASFADVSSYDGLEVPFFKRAQLAAADVRRAGLAEMRGEERLTAFADNLVPHVLRLDGVLRLEPGLAASIDHGDLLAHGSAPEVELRACAVHAVDLIAGATGGRLSPAAIDAALWERGGIAGYKSVPRPRSRNTAY